MGKMYVMSFECETFTGKNAFSNYLMNVFLFFWFHSVFTRYPLITLGVCTTFVVGMSVGIFFMEITTDPVELWAGPHSRSRAEKDYFDNTFGPFYRTAQVFIKPTYKENVILTKSYHITALWICGPFLNRNFLVTIHRLYMIPLRENW